MPRFDAARLASLESVDLSAPCDTDEGRLNERQRDVLYLMCKGLRNAESHDSCACLSALSSGMSASFS